MPLGQRGFFQPKAATSCRTISARFAAVNWKFGDSVPENQAPTRPRRTDPELNRF
jgi:hypothetical protein